MWAQMLVELFLQHLKDLGIRHRRTDSLEHFLRSHLDLADALIPMLSRIAFRLSQSNELTLVVYRGPETPDEHLLLLARTHDYDENLLESLAVLQAEMGRAIEAASGWFLVSTDFLPPDLPDAL
jgi:hypothetical protein